MKFRMVFCGPDDGSSTRPAVEKSSSGGRPAVCYEQQGAGMVRRERLADGRCRDTPITNFGVRIVTDILRNEGSVRQREFALQADLGGRLVEFTLSAAEFGRMDWVLDRLGPQAIIYPGQRQHARAAIQWLSGVIAQEQIDTEMGWRQHADQWVYVHAGGAVGADGAVAGTRVQLPVALQPYQLSVPVDEGKRRYSVQASMQLLDAAPDRISIPLLAATYRAALGGVNFGVYLSGPSGVFKTALAAVCQQHFGATMGADHLPGNFASTGNALEWLAGAVHDALLVVDDFAPTGGPGDASLQALGERLFRAIGNHQVRGRMQPSGHIRVPPAPGGLVLATGEQVPAMRSILARLLVVEVRPGEVDRMRLQGCQRAGEEGVLAASMGAFVGWLAEHYEARPAALRQRVMELRSRWQGNVRHSRAADALSELQAGMELFLQFAEQVGALGGVARQKLQTRMMLALGELGRGQSQYQEVGDPALQFVAGLRAALADGRAHLADRRGRSPQDAAACGWERKGRGKTWWPRGVRIGWAAGNEVYLDSSASYRVVQDGFSGAGLGISEPTLRQRLRERGLLASVDGGRKTLRVRRILDGTSRDVLHLSVRTIFEASA